MPRAFASAADLSPPFMVKRPLIGKNTTPMPGWTIGGEIQVLRSRLTALDSLGLLGNGQLETLIGLVEMMDPRVIVILTHVITEI